MYLLYKIYRGAFVVNEHQLPQLYENGEYKAENTIGIPNYNKKFNCYIYEILYSGYIYEYYNNYKLNLYKLYIHILL